MSGTTAKSYTAKTLTANVIYTFKVNARNLVGFGADAVVNVRAAAKPDFPAKPSTSVNSNKSVTISWTEPYDGGSPITSYTVDFRQSDGLNYITESDNCNVSETSCTIPIAALQISPYNLPWGASIYATVIASNLVGSSITSSSGRGAIITTNPGEPT